MIKTAVIHASTSLAAADNGGGGFPITGENVMQFIVQVLAPLVLAWIGIGILSRARKSNAAETANTGFNSLIGIMFVGGAVVIASKGADVANWLFG